MAYSIWQEIRARPHLGKSFNQIMCEFVHELDRNGNLTPLTPEYVLRPWPVSAKLATHILLRMDGGEYYRPGPAPKRENPTAHVCLTEAEKRIWKNTRYLQSCDNLSDADTLRGFVKALRVQRKMRREIPPYIRARNWAWDIPSALAWICGGLDIGWYVPAVALEKYALTFPGDIGEPSPTNERTDDMEPKITVNQPPAKKQTQLGDLREGEFFRYASFNIPANVYVVLRAGTQDPHTLPRIKSLRTGEVFERTSILSNVMRLRLTTITFERIID